MQVECPDLVSIVLMLVLMMIVPAGTVVFSARNVSNWSMVDW
jgi:hypothetical protein